MGHNPRMDLCPKSKKKMKKNEEFGRNGFWVEDGGKIKSWPNGRPAVGGLTGERPAVVLRWWGRRLVAVGWGILDVRE
jgi:hypothetical protein